MVESIQGTGGWRPELDFDHGDAAAGPPAQVGLLGPIGWVEIALSFPADQ